MTGYNPLSFETEGLKRRLTGLERDVADIRRDQSWRFDEEVDLSPGSTFYVRRVGAFPISSGTVAQIEWDGGAFTSGAAQFASWSASAPGEVQITMDGLYWMASALSLADESRTGTRYMEIGVNGTSASGFDNAAAFGPIEGWSGGVSFSAAHMSTAIALPLSAGDFVAVYVEQTSGVSLSMGLSPIPQLSITRFAGEITTF